MKVNFLSPAWFYSMLIYSKERRFLFSAIPYRHEILVYTILKLEPWESNHLKIGGFLPLLAVLVSYMNEKIASDPKHLEA